MPAIIVGTNPRIGISRSYRRRHHRPSERSVSPGATAFNQLVIPERTIDGRFVVIIIMGVAGSGKTTIGRRLAEHLGWPFFDADDFHSPTNVARMRAGEPLTDELRAQWLDDLRRAIAEHIRSETSMVLACSALRQRYRDALHHADEPIRWVYLHGDFATIEQRITSRQDHYMPPALLKSQFATLEEPANALKVSVSVSPVEAVTTIVTQLFPNRP